MVMQLKIVIAQGLKTHLPILSFGMLFFTFEFSPLKVLRKSVLIERRV